jgi:protein TonB
MRTIIFVLGFILTISCQKEELLELEPLSNLTNEREEYLEHICVQDVPPEWIEGTNQELLALIFAQLKHPPDECISGTTVLSFMVDKTGEVREPVIRRSISQKIDEQLIRIIQNYRFKPGKTFGGTVVPFQMNFPIKIRLDSPGESTFE